MLQGKRLGPYKLERLLGSGSFGEVYEAWDKTHKEYVAVKILQDNERGEKEYQYEMAAHRFLSERPTCHKYVVCLFAGGYYDARATLGLRLRSTFQPQVKENYYYLVTELMDGNLADLKNTPYDRWTLDHPLHVAYLFFGLLKGLQYIHQQGLAHKDIKPENIMYRLRDSDGQTMTWDMCLQDPTFVIRFFHLKYGDLGLSCTSAGRDARADKDLSRFILRTCSSGQGTPAYLAPEMVRRNIKKIPFARLDEDQAADLWALGMTCWMLMYGDYPDYLHQANSVRKFTAIMLGLEQRDIDELLISHPLPIDDEDLRVAITDILRGLLTVDPQQRMTAEQALFIISNFV
jgi:serine/threonine protein kinase